MGLFAQSWVELGYSEDTSSKVVKKFKANLDFAVARDYPWLAAELYMVEGELGWCPGFRDYPEDLYVLHETPSAKSQMMNFLRVLDDVLPDTSIKDAIVEAVEGRPSTKYAMLLQKSLACVKKHHDGREGRLINKVYGLIASNRSEYALGAARIYRDMWQKNVNRNFAFILAGLFKIYIVPPDRIEVSAETVMRKRFKALHGFEAQLSRTMLLTGEAC